MGVLQVLGQAWLSFPLVLLPPLPFEVCLTFVPPVLVVALVFRVQPSTRAIAVNAPPCLWQVTAADNALMPPQAIPGYGDPSDVNTYAILKEVR